MKKAQTEVIGLLVIVLIIFVLLVFAMRNLITPGTDFESLYKPESLSTDWVNAFLNTESYCTPKTDFSKVIIDCAKFPPDGSVDFTCSLPPHAGKKSCDFAQEVIEGLLQETVEVWKYDYEFRVLGPSGQNIQKLNFQSFTNQTDSISTTLYKLKVNTGSSAIVQIMLCIGGPCEDT